MVVVVSWGCVVGLCGEGGCVMVMAVVVSWEVVWWWWLCGDDAVVSDGCTRAHVLAVVTNVCSPILTPYTHIDR